MTRKTLSVPDISCEHCERAIVEALTPLVGVEAVKVDIPERQVMVDFDEQIIGVSRIADVLGQEDYPVSAVS